jgi:hypothetical protein
MLFEVDGLYGRHGVHGLNRHDVIEHGGHIDDRLDDRHRTHRIESTALL